MQSPLHAIEFPPSTAFGKNKNQNQRQREKFDLRDGFKYFAVRYAGRLDASTSRPRGMQMALDGEGDELQVASSSLKSSCSPGDFARVFGVLDSFFDESLPHKQ